MLLVGSGCSALLGVQPRLVELSGECPRDLKQALGAVADGDQLKRSGKAALAMLFHKYFQPLTEHALEFLIQLCCSFT